MSVRMIFLNLFRFSEMLLHFLNCNKICFHKLEYFNLNVIDFNSYTKPYNNKQNILIFKCQWLVFLEEFGTPRHIWFLEHQNLSRINNRNH